jgi:hypothetical protein
MPETTAKTLTIIEPICYLNPHKEQLVSDHPAMIGSWRYAINISRKVRGAMLAPLLVDDIDREGSITSQTVDDIITATATELSYSDLPWLGGQVIESEIEKQYGNLGCKMFDCLYHRDVLSQIALIAGDSWEWIVVHPAIFKDQQSGMLLNLWKMLEGDMNWSALSQQNMVNKDKLRAIYRDKFLSHFQHVWMDDSGEPESVTRPVFEGGKVKHK